MPGETSDPRDRELEALRRENADLRREVQDLKRQLADALKKLEEALRSQKRQAAPFSKGPPKANPKRRGRKPGKGYGVPSRRSPPPTVDDVIEVPLPPRCECGGHIKYDETVEQYQTEIPQKPIHRRFDIDVGHCLACGNRVQGRHSLQTSDAIGAAAPQLGPDAQAMTALLKTKLGLSYGDVQTLFRNFFGIGLSRGGAAHIVVRVAHRIEAAYHGIELVVRRSRVVYPDETGWKVGGLLEWLWVFVARTATLVRIRPSRGHDVPEEILGLDWNGILVHDGWSPYDQFKQAFHQQCLGHIQRRCKDLLDTLKPRASQFPEAVLNLLGDAFRLRDRRDEGTVSPRGLAVASGRLEMRLVELLRWEIRHPANVKLRKHLRNHWNEILFFLRHPEIEATSWPADHAIRPAVANRKVFGGNRDPAGAHAHEVLMSVDATGLQRGIDVFQYLSHVIRVVRHRRDAATCRLLGLPVPR